MFGAYREILRIPGAPAFSTAGLIGRLPIAMISLSVVLLQTSRGMSYALAGTISAAFAVAAAVGGPVVSGFVDRHGQHRILPSVSVAYALFMVGLIVAMDMRTALPVILLLALGAGLMMPNVGSLVRARWAYVCPNNSELHVAYAWESILDEVIFVVGPPLATVLVLQVAPEAGLVACIVFLLAGAAWLVRLRGTEPPRSSRSARTGRPAIASRGMPLLVVVFVLIGGVFGSFEVVTVAFAAEQGASGATGLLLALYAISSMVAGIVYGATRSPEFHGRRMDLMLTLMAVVTIGLPLAPNVYALGVVALLAGMAVSPVLISGTALVERIVPSSQLTEGITWTTTGMALGLAISAPVSGVVIDSAGARAAYLVTAGCAVVGCMVAWIGARSTQSAEVEALKIIAEKPSEA